MVRNHKKGETKMRYFLITCPRGHCGVGQYTDISFAIAARNLLEAMDKAKRMPGVKHTRAILAGKEITFDEYKKFRSVSAYERNARSAW